MIRINLLPGPSASLTVAGWLAASGRAASLGEAADRLQVLQGALETANVPARGEEASRIRREIERGERDARLLLWRVQDFFTILRADRSTLSLLERHPGTLERLRKAAERPGGGPYREEGSALPVPAGHAAALTRRPAEPPALSRAVSRSSDWIRLGGRWVWGGLKTTTMIAFGVLMFGTMGKDGDEWEELPKEAKEGLRRLFVDPWRFHASADVWALQDRAESGEITARERLKALAAKGNEVAAVILEDLARRGK